MPKAGRFPPASQPRQTNDGCAPGRADCTDQGFVAGVGRHGTRDADSRARHGDVVEAADADAGAELAGKEVPEGIAQDEDAYEQADGVDRGAAEERSLRQRVVEQQELVEHAEERSDVRQEPRWIGSAGETGTDEHDEDIVVLVHGDYFIKTHLAAFPADDELENEDGDDDGGKRAMVEHQPPADGHIGNS